MPCLPNDLTDVLDHRQIQLVMTTRGMLLDCSTDDRLRDTGYNRQTVSELGNGLVYYVVFLFSTTLHEAAHAWAAMRGGDLTAYHGGQVTLDPRPHIQREPFGMVAIPILSVMLSGWPFGFATAPYDPHWAMQYRGERRGWRSRDRRRISRWLSSPRAPSESAWRQECSPRRTQSALSRLLVRRSQVSGPALRFL